MAEALKPWSAPVVEVPGVLAGGRSLLAAVLDQALVRLLHRHEFAGIAVVVVRVDCVRQTAPDDVSNSQRIAPALQYASIRAGQRSSMPAFEPYSAPVCQHQSRKALQYASIRAGHRSIL